MIMWTKVGSCKPAEKAPSVRQIVDEAIKARKRNKTDMWAGRLPCGWKRESNPIGLR